MPDTPDNGTAIKVGRFREAYVRIELVEMLFALAIAELATKVSDLASYWSDISSQAPAVAQLVLAAALITTSWVGWRVSRAPGNRTELKGVYTGEFVVLLLDVVLVILYFIVVRTTEASPGSGVPSAIPESVCTTLVFLLYVLWDFQTKYVMADREESPGERIRSRSWNELLKRWPITLACLVLSGWLCIVAYRSLSPASVTLCDVTLILTVLAFRAGKPNGALRRRHKLGTWAFIVGAIACSTCVVWLTAP